ncbi:hypothetical protein HPP92_025398 [Vanilla planifolia]|uniref:Peptidase M41 domain-containing protein n=1 Tax=Vanilla planifolia TaxID=51239 RepID=A0A835PGK4_VANPL|nr:hypothetical protein HPP92_025398 [Vanilla planifolia]
MRTPGFSGADLANLLLNEAAIFGWPPNVCNDGQIAQSPAQWVTWFIPIDDPTLISKQQLLLKKIVGGLGEQSCEEVIFEPEVTTGAAGDLQQITALAKQHILAVLTKRQA